MTKIIPDLSTYEDAIEKWHQGDGEIPIHEYLGLTWAKYCEMVQGKVIPAEKEASEK